MRTKSNQSIFIQFMLLFCDQLFGSPDVHNKNEIRIETITKETE